MVHLQFEFTPSKLRLLGLLVPSFQADNMNIKSIISPWLANHASISPVDSTT